MCFERDAERGEKIAPEILDKIAGTDLDMAPISTGSRILSPSGPTPKKAPRQAEPSVTLTPHQMLWPTRMAAADAIQLNRGLGPVGCPPAGRALLLGGAMTLADLLADLLAQVRQAYSRSAIRNPEFPAAPLAP
jgi:hypothetical protein